MSRIDDALKRARIETVREDAETRRADLHAVDTPIVPSWQLDRLPSEEADRPATALTRDGRIVSARQTAGRGSVSEVVAGPGAGRRPHVSPLPKRDQGPALSEKLIAGAPAGGPSHEQYRRLAATLHESQIQNPELRVLLVVSAAAAEGKTLTAANLALTLSNSYGRKVLLVDADLRRPTVHELFQLSNNHGLVDGLQAESDAPLRTAEISPNLQVLTAGEAQADPMGLLISERMGRLLTDAASAFEWVIVDTPPVAVVPDAHLLAQMAHAAILVVRAGRTPHDLITAAVNALGKERIAGVVLNAVSESELPGGYDRYGYGYGYATGRD